MIRKIVIIFACFALNAQAQFAVIDVNAATQWVQQIASTKQQIDNLRSQLTQAKQTYDSIAGTRNIGNLLKNQLLTQALPQEYLPVLQAIRSGTDGKMGGLSSQILATISATQIRSCGDQYNNVNERAACELRWRQLAAIRVSNDNAYQASFKNIANLEQFVNGITSAPDAKTIADLQARIQLEQIRVTNEQTKMATIKAMQDAQDKIDAENNKEASRASLRKTSSKQIAF